MIRDPEADRQAAEMALKAIAGTVSAFFPELEYDPATIRAGSEKLAPLMSRPWFIKLFGSSGQAAGRWAAEIDAAIFFAGVVFHSVQTVQAARAKQHENEAGSQEPGDQGKPDDQDQGAAGGTSIYQDPNARH